MIETVGALLRAWRIKDGWTQADLAESVHVTAGAVSAWETGVRRISLHALERLDAVLGAEGCLIDLARAMGPPALEPRVRWGHVFHGPPGPGWAWIRPARAGLVRGLGGLRLFAYTIDHEVGPHGLFVVAPWLDPQCAIDIAMDEPVWVDFGRGVPPPWLGIPVMTSYALRDVVLRRPRDRMLQFIVDTARRRCRGYRGMLRDRLRSLVDVKRWDALEDQWRLGIDAPLPPAKAGSDDPRPPRTPEDQRVVHRRLREARELSQADAAELATRVLRAEHVWWTSSDPPTRSVTAMQIHNYEAGRTSRVKHLPALLDMAYDANGWSCFERVPVTQTRTGTYEARFPDYWIGPVSFAVRPPTTTSAPATPSPMTLTWAARRLDLARPVQATSFQCVRFPNDANLAVQVPPRWTVQAWMGADPDAQLANDDWIPVSRVAGDLAFDELVAALPRALGVAEHDLRRALNGERHGRPAPSALNAVLHADRQPVALEHSLSRHTDERRLNG